MINVSEKDAPLGKKVECVCKWQTIKESGPSTQGNFFDKWAQICILKTESDVSVFVLWMYFKKAFNHPLKTE